MSAKFEIKMARNKKLFFVLIAKNGEKIAQSEMYNSKQAVIGGIASIKANVDAEIIDTTIPVEI